MIRIQGIKIVSRQKWDICWLADRVAIWKNVALSTYKRRARAKEYFTSNESRAHLQPCMISVLYRLGELDDSQKEKIEELLSKICKQDEELLTQRKQLIELSKLVEKQEEELLRRDDKLKEQMYVSKVQEKKLEERGKEIVHMIKTQETMKEEEEMEKTENEKQVFIFRSLLFAKFCI